MPRDLDELSYPETQSQVLAGKVGLVTGIANDQSIAYGCARALRDVGASLAITYLNEKVRPYVEPLPGVLGAELFLPLAQLRRFEHFKGSKCLRLLRWTPEGRHYSGVGGAGARAVILGGGWAGSSSFSLFSKRLSSGSGSV